MQELGKMIGKGFHTFAEHRPRDPRRIQTIKDFEDNINTHIAMEIEEAFALANPDLTQEEHDTLRTTDQSFRQNILSDIRPLLSKRNTSTLQPEEKRLLELRITQTLLLGPYIDGLGTFIDCNISELTEIEAEEHGQGTVGFRRSLAYSKVFFETARVAFDKVFPSQTPSQGSQIIS